MTTTEQVAPPCNTDRCDDCDFPESAGQHGDV